MERGDAGLTETEVSSLVFSHSAGNLLFTLNMAGRVFCPELELELELQQKLVNLTTLLIDKNRSD